MSRIGTISTRFFREIGEHRLSVSVRPAGAAKLFEMWDIATDRGFAENRQTLVMPNVFCKESFEVPSRDLDKASVRLGLEHARSRAGW